MASRRHSRTKIYAKQHESLADKVLIEDHIDFPSHMKQAKRLCIEHQLYISPWDTYLNSGITRWLGHEYPYFGIASSDTSNHILVDVLKGREIPVYSRSKLCVAHLGLEALKLSLFSTYCKPRPSFSVKVTKICDPAKTPWSEHWIVLDSRD